MGNNLKFNNYNELDSFIDNELIPNYIIYEKVLEKEGLKLSAFIKPSVLEDIGLNDDDYRYVIEYLTKKEIEIREIDYSKNQKYKNYEIFKICEVLRSNGITPLTNKEQLPLFEELRKTKDPCVREKLILSNIEYVYHILSEFNSIELNDDTFQVALEGLIKAVDSYKLNYDYGFAFQQYLFQFIVNNIRLHYPELRSSFGGDQNRLWQLSFKKYRNMVEETHGCSINEDESLVDEIVDLMIKNKDISKNTREENINRIKFHFCNISLEEHYDELSQIEDKDFNMNLESIIYNSELRDKIYEILETVPLRNKQIIEMRFGLDGKGPKTLAELAEVFDLTREGIRQIEVKTLNKFYTSENKQKLYEYSDYDEKLYQILNKLKKSYTIIGKEYLKEYMKYFKYNSKNREMASQVLLEYEYYCQNRNKILKQIKKLIMEQELPLSKNINEIFDILTDEEKDILTRFVLNKIEDFNEIYVFTNANDYSKSINNAYILASAVKKICYYYHHNITNNEYESEKNQLCLVRKSKDIK